jgi:hypothetical protein
MKQANSPCSHHRVDMCSTCVWESPYMMNKSAWNAASIVWTDLRLRVCETVADGKASQVEARAPLATEQRFRDAPRVLEPRPPPAPPAQQALDLQHKVACTRGKPSPTHADDPLSMSRPSVILGIGAFPASRVETRSNINSPRLTALQNGAQACMKGPSAWR